VPSNTVRKTATGITERSFGMFGKFITFICLEKVKCGGAYLITNRRVKPEGPAQFMGEQIGIF
jgi:hypothetical protein